MIYAPDGTASLRAEPVPADEIEVTLNETARTFEVSRGGNKFEQQVSGHEITVELKVNCEVLADDLLEDLRSNPIFLAPRGRLILKRVRSTHPPRHDSPSGSSFLLTFSTAFLR